MGRSSYLVPCFISRVLTLQHLFHCLLGCCRLLPKDRFEHARFCFGFFSGLSSLGLGALAFDLSGGQFGSECACLVLIKPIDVSGVADFSPARHVSSHIKGHRFLSRYVCLTPRPCNITSFKSFNFVLRGQNSINKCQARSRSPHRAIGSDCVSTHKAKCLIGRDPHKPGPCRSQIHFRC